MRSICLAVRLQLIDDTSLHPIHLCRKQGGPFSLNKPSGLRQAMNGMQRQIVDAETDAVRIAGERQSRRLVTAFVVTGLLFMLLLGIFLGVWNLLGISAKHHPSSIPQAWLQAHGRQN